MSYVKKNPNEVSFFLYFRNIRDKSYYMIDDICKLLCNSGYECEIGYYNSSRIIKILFKQNSIEHDLSNNPYIVDIDINMYMDCVVEICKELNIDYVLA